MDLTDAAFHRVTGRDGQGTILVQFPFHVIIQPFRHRELPDVLVHFEAASIDNLLMNPINCDHIPDDFNRQFLRTELRQIGKRHLRIAKSYSELFPVINTSGP